MQVFVLCAKTPRPARLTAWGYSKTATPGVYRSENLYVREIPLIILNALGDEPHNAFVKCFASHKKAKQAAFATLSEGHFARLPWLLWIFLIGLRRLWAVTEGESKMTEQLTPEEVLALGQEWEQLLLSQMSIEERLAGLNPEEVLAQYKPEEVLAQYKPEERVAGLKPEERLAGLSLDEVEAWLEQHRSRKATTKRDIPPGDSARNN